MTNVTVIGCGFMGEHHAQAVSEHPTLSLASVVDVDEDRSEEVAAAYNADSALTDFETALSGADAVVVATPEPLHEEQANAVLDAGLDLLLEKPITDSVETAQELAERTAASDQVTGVSFILRYDPAYATALNRARDGILGDIVTARGKRAITVGESRRIGERGHPNFYMSIHDIDAILAAVGEPVETVSAVERRGKLTDMDVPDAVQALLTFEDGSTGVLEGYGVLPDETPGGIVADFEVVGTDGTAVVETPGNTVEVLGESFERPDTRHWPVVNGEMDGAVRRQIDRFARAIAGDAEMEATVTDGYRAQRIAEAIRHAAESGDQITVDSIP